MGIEPQLPVPQTGVLTTILSRLWLALKRKISESSWAGIKPASPAWQTRILSHYTTKTVYSISHNFYSKRVAGCLSWIYLRCKLVSLASRSIQWFRILIYFTRKFACNFRSVSKNKVRQPWTTFSRSRSKPVSTSFYHAVTLSELIHVLTLTLHRI